ncbi:MAG: DUF4351 domain-containing protein [Cyanobacteria bacterium J06649_4]
MRSVLEESVTYQSILAEGHSKGRQEGRQEATQQLRQQQIELLLDILPLKVGEISEPTQQKVAALSIEQLGVLGKRLKGFETPQDLDAWLMENPD